MEHFSIYMYCNFLRYLWGIVPGPPQESHQRCLSPLYKTAQDLHLTHAGLSYPLTHLWITHNTQCSVDAVDLAVALHV